MTETDAKTSQQKRDLLADLLKQRQTKVVPASFAQERLWVLDQIEPDTAHYNLSIAIELQGELNLDALNQAFGEVVRRHETLRTTFVLQNEAPAQLIHKTVEVKIDRFDLSDFNDGGKEAEAQRLSSLVRGQPFNLVTGPLFRVSLIRMEAKVHRLILTLHHIVTDGWSNSILVNELGELYRAAVCGDRARLPELEIQYSDFAAWQKARLRDGALSDQLEYWSGQLTDITPLNLPTDRARPAIQTFNGALQIDSLSAELTTKVRDLCQARGASVYMFMLAGFNILLQRYARQDDIAVGSPIANRNRAEIENLIGFFVNSLVIRTDLSGDPDFLTLLERVKENTLAAFENQDLPFEKLVEELQPERNRSMSPLFQVLFTVQNMPAREFELTGLAFRIPQTEINTVRFDLEVHVWEQADGLTLGFIYNTDLFDASTVERTLTHYRKLLTQIVDNPAGRIGDMEMVTEPEYQLVVDRWNRTDFAFPSPQCSVQEMFEAAVTRFPDAIAVESGQLSLSYRQLNSRANRLAHYLRKHGVGPDVVVGICLPRGLDAVVAMLAVLKAGGAYTPLDASYPGERLVAMLQDAQCALVITVSELDQELPECDVLSIRLNVDDWNECDEQNPVARTRAEDLAYVIFTSGSTGRPKGIAMPHSVLLNLLNWQLLRSEELAGGRTLQFSALGFDVCFQEIFSTWCGGGTLVLIDEALRRDPMRLLYFIHEAEITRLFMPFAGLNQLCEVACTEELVPRRLKEVVTAGEALQVTPAMEYLFDSLPDCILDNHYGPSETHVATAYRLTDSPREWPRLPPIGRPVANAKIYILDDRMRPVPIGVPGELYIAGECLARGYVGRADLTEERFIANPFDDTAGSRMYRSGDLARYRSDGEIEYLGRADTQVKLRGYRVELSEIETVLMEYETVSASVATLHEDPAGDRRLVAYYVGADVEPKELRIFLQQKLPGYMQPAVLVELEALPLTPSGKVNRRALPAPGNERQAAEAFVEPATKLERELAAIWRDLLNIDRIGINDNFFDLGGHSLMTTRVVSRIRKLYKLDLSVASLFEHSTIASLAEFIESMQWANESSGIADHEARREDRQVGEL